MKCCSKCGSTKIRHSIRKGPARTGNKMVANPVTGKMQLARCNGDIEYRCRKHIPTR